MRLLKLILFALACASAAGQAAPGAPPAPSPRSGDFAWLLQNIREEHPRVFVSADNLGAVKARALGAERPLYDKIKAGLGALAGQKIEFKDLEIADGTQSRDHEHGFRAADAALVWLLEQDPASLALAKSLLRGLGDYYNQRNRAGRNIHWYAYSRIAALAAFDWVYPALTPEERLELGRPLLEAISVMAIRGGRKAFLRENTGGHTTGFYGPPCLAWYAGLVFHKTGIDDALALKLLQKGHDDHVKLLGHRARLHGRAGGAASPTIAYTAGDYPWAEFNFFHTFQSATGFDITREWRHPPRFYYYLLWHWLPGNLSFGFGDENHFTNALALQNIRVHLSQMAHFYGDAAPEFTALAKWMFARAGAQGADKIPFTRFLLSRFNPEDFEQNTAPAASAAPATPTAPPLPSLPSAVFFKNMGQVSMRSGSGPGDTHALFTSGGLVTNHKHYDNNNFVIYKHGFRALDSGSRPEPGQHLTHYFCRTVAHNCVLIKMPGETFPKYWGDPAASETPLPIPNDGGQRDLLASTVTGFSQNSEYVYVASDATASYHRDKAGLVLRQFVFVQPDVFLVFDKVTSTRAEYKKTWLLHTASEPRITAPDEFCETSGGGRLFCRVLFPKNAILSKIGGPGKQFWSDGRNWPLPVLSPDDWSHRGSAYKLPRDETPLLGQWRVEVCPASENTHDEFLHLIQVGGLSLDAMIATRPFQSDDALGVEFDYNGRRYKVAFKRGPEHGGAITITRDGHPILDEPFTQTAEESCAPF